MSIILILRRRESVKNICTHTHADKDWARKKDLKKVWEGDGVKLTICY